MKKKPLMILLLALGVAVFFALLLYPTVSNYVNTRNQSRVVTNYLDDSVGMNEGERDALLEAAHAYNRYLLTKKNRYKFTDEETTAYKNLLDTGHGMMGVLAIDKIGVNLPIYHGTDEGVLQIGIGHLHGSSLPVGGSGTHTVITGHRGLPSSKLLTNLDRLMEGDLFVLHILDETLTYQVDQILTVKPEEVNSLDIERGMDYCTLVTCTPYGKNTHRLLVRGNRVENVEGPGGEAGHTGMTPASGALITGMCMILLLSAFLIYVFLRWRKTRKGG